MAAAFHKVFGYFYAFPAGHRRNFNLMFLDVAFWGILNGSTVVFLAIYASRLGASAAQIGLLTASPALMNMLFSFAASNFSRGKSVYVITRWAWLITRIFYLFLIPIPLFLPAQTQIWVIIVITLLMNVSGTVAAVIGNAFFADAVPLRFRGSVVGTRNALLAVTSTLTSLAVGQILKNMPFAQGYSIVFTIGCVGATLSLIALFMVRPVKDSEAEAVPEDAQSDPSSKGGIRLEIIRGQFGRVVLTSFIFQAAVFWANPVFPLYQVHSLKLSDVAISQGTSLFWVVYFLASTQSGELARRWGFRKLFGIGTFGTGLALLIITYASQNWIYMAAQVVSGTAWAWIGGGMINYVLERVPANDRPSHLAWFNMAVNAAILAAGLLVPRLLGLGGSETADASGLFLGMLLGTLFRFLAAGFILFFG